MELRRSTTNRLAAVVFGLLGIAGVAAAKLFSDIRWAAFGALCGVAAVQAGRAFSSRHAAELDRREVEEYAGARGPAERTFRHALAAGSLCAAGGLALLLGSVSVAPEWLGSRLRTVLAGAALLVFGSVLCLLLLLQRRRARRVWGRG